MSKILKIRPFSITLVSVENVLSDMKISMGVTISVRAVYLLAYVNETSRLSKLPFRRVNRPSIEGSTRRAQSEHKASTRRAEIMHKACTSGRCFRRLNSRTHSSIIERTGRGHRPECNVIHSALPGYRSVHRRLDRPPMHRQVQVQKLSHLSALGQEGSCARIALDVTPSRANSRSRVSSDRCTTSDCKKCLQPMFMNDFTPRKFRFHDNHVVD